MGWTKAQAKFIAREAIKRAGTGGWRLMTREAREAWISEAILTVVLGQHAPTVQVEAIQQLWLEARRAAGLSMED